MQNIEKRVAFDPKQSISLSPYFYLKWSLCTDSKTFHHLPHEKSQQTPCITSQRKIPEDFCKVMLPNIDICANQC